VYMPFNAPIGAGGQAEPFVFPALRSDTLGNPLPLQPEIPGAVAGGAASPSPSFPGGVPVVLPWVDYGTAGGGGVSASAAPWQTTMTPAGSRFAAMPAGRGANGEPPWSDALSSRPAGCCGGSRSLLQWVKQHPWLALGAVVAVVCAVKGTE